MVFRQTYDTFAGEDEEEGEEEDDEPPPAAPYKCSFSSAIDILGGAEGAFLDGGAFVGAVVVGTATAAAAGFAMATTALDSGLSVANTASSFGVKGAAAVASGAARATTQQHSTSRRTMMTESCRMTRVVCGVVRMCWTVK